MRAVEDSSSESALASYSEQIARPVKEEDEISTDQPGAHAYTTVGGPPGLRLGAQIGTGQRCDVFAACFDGAGRNDLVVKRYRTDAILKHESLADSPLAEFEYQRNRACFDIPGLDRNVARPVGFHVGTDGQWLVQQRVAGDLCGNLCTGWSARQWSDFRARLLDLITLVHHAGIHDLDLHPYNVMLVHLRRKAEPVLFDFNLVPFTERRRPTLDGWLYRFGLIRADHRDMRRLRNRFR